MLTSLTGNYLIADCQLATPITFNRQSKIGNRQCHRLVSRFLHIHVTGVRTAATAILHVVVLHVMILHVLHVMIGCHVVGHCARATFAFG